MEPLKPDYYDTEQLFKSIGRHIHTSLREIATHVGGEEFAAEVSLAAESGDTSPYLASLQLLKERFPGAEEFVMDRAIQIQSKEHERELAELRKPTARKFGRSLLIGFVSIGGGMSSIGEGMSRIQLFPRNIK